MADYPPLTVNPAFSASNWGDQGDGTFRNPILPGDFSDPDVIRVGSDYYFITSTFAFSPGMAIMHSCDLVNWRYLSHCVDDISRMGPELNWDRMNRYDRGIYAGAIRYHAGKFWVYYTTLDEGLFLTTATDPAGPWEPVYRVWDGYHYDDPCPIWDDDGKAYMVMSHPGHKQWYTYLYDMAPDGRSIDPSSATLLDGFHTSEGNKIYKINGMYYVFHNECVTWTNRVGVMMRSRNIRGPWEKRRFLHGSPEDREPNQGALVQTASGEWVFVTHHGTCGYYEGRPTSLLPVQWEDGWPFPGKPDGSDISNAGTMIWSLPMPVGGEPVLRPQTSDDFDSPKRAPQWEWNHQPRAEKWSLSERPGHLRLHAFKPLEPNHLLKAGNTLTQRIMGRAGGQITLKLDLAGMADGQQAGLCHFSKLWQMIGAIQNGGLRRLTFNLAGKSTQGPVLSGNILYLRSDVDAQGVSRCSYSLDGDTFTPFGEPCSLTWAFYRGSRIGIYCFNEAAEAGFVDCDWFQYTLSGGR